MTAAPTSVPPTVVVDGPNVSGVAMWCGDSRPPVDSTADVELEITGEVSWRDIVRDTDTIVNDVRRAVSGDQLVVRGVVTEVDHVGVLVLDVAGAIVLVDTLDERPQGVVGSTVVIVTCRASVFPTKI